MAKKATTHDAQLILKLYDLRREAEMRKARNWFMAEFWPQSADDVMKVVNAFPSQENAWLRQVGSFWDMAAGLVVHGALSEELFLASSGELFFLFAKIHPFLKEIREKMNNPEAYANIEKVATGSKLAWNASPRMWRIAAKRWPSRRRRADRSERASAVLCSSSSRPSAILDRLCGCSGGSSYWESVRRSWCRLRLPSLCGSGGK